MNSVAKSTTNDPINQLHEAEPRWFAVYTKYKREKMIDKRLRERGIDVYLPLQKVTRHYTRKVKHLELPLISCHIFTRITRKEYVPVLQDPDVLKFVRIAKDLIAIPEREMDIMRRIVGEEVEAVAEPASFQLGQEVEVIGGRLTGLRGLLVDRHNEKTFILEVPSLGYEFRMEVDPALLQPTGRRYRSGSQGKEGWFEKY